MPYISNLEYFLVFILLLSSGSPLVIYIGKFVYIPMAIYSVYKLSGKGESSTEKDSFIKIIRTLLILAFLLFALQYLEFGSFAFADNVLFICKILFGGYVYYVLGIRFKYALMQILFALTIISLICYSLVMTTGLPFQSSYSGGVTFLGLYCHRTGELRNCGAFWEPGVFACYINFLFVLFSNDLRGLWTNHRKKFIVLVIGLLSTQSTTGYLVFAFIVALYFLLVLRSRWRYILIPLFSVVVIYSFVRLDFLHSKILEQNSRAEMAAGEYDSSRIGAFIFDLYYIQKRPFIGNGLSLDTQYDEHKDIIQMWKDRDVDMNGNGLSSFTMSMGIPFLIILFILFWRNNNGISVKIKVLAILSILLMLNGEPLMLYPMLLSLSFIRYEENT